MVVATALLDETLRAGAHRAEAEAVPAWDLNVVVATALHQTCFTARWCTVRDQTAPLPLDRAPTVPTDAAVAVAEVVVATMERLALSLAQNSQACTVAFRLQRVLTTTVVDEAVAAEVGVAVAPIGDEVAMVAIAEEGVLLLRRRAKVFYFSC